MSCRRARGFLRVASFINPGINFKACRSRGTVHELPHANGAGTASNRRTESAFTKGEILEFIRYIFFREDFLNHREVGVTALYPDF